LLKALIKEARPTQWSKNLLVFAAPGALGVLNQWEPLWKSLVVFVAFCLVASGTYYWNDIKDVSQDRLHPKKKYRPIASGDIPLGVARVVGTGLLGAGPLLALLVRPQAGAVLALYALLTLGYSTRLKHVPLLDLAIVSSGFVLRAMAGAAATTTPMSNWFVLCVTFGSFFIVTGKRFAELLELGASAGDTRTSLKSYTLDGAYAEFEEKFKGSIEVGKAADFTVYDKNIMEIPEDEILQAKVLLTVVGGKVVYKKQ
jgi:decaprenyl-phosphate phosphoribosyltransferase